MIPGAGANGQYPNLAIGLPIVKRARSAAVRIEPAKQAKDRIEPTIDAKLNQFPNDD